MEQLEEQAPELAAYVQASPDELAPPHQKLPESVRARYREARDVAALSPRAAAALLRLALEELLDEFQPSGAKLVDRIGELHKAGLPVPDRQAMDILRHVGNDAVHAGTIMDADNPATVRELFRYLNHLAESGAMIQAITARYTSLPQGKQDADQHRNTKEGCSSSVGTVVIRLRGGRCPGRRVCGHAGSRGRGGSASSGRSPRWW